MQPTEKVLEKSASRIWLLLAAAACFLGFGFMLGQPLAKPYLLEGLLLCVAVGLSILGAAAVYIFVKPVKSSQSLQSVAYAFAVAMFLVALFFVGKWISMA